MKARFPHIVLSALLLGNLIFTQLVIHYFHEHHSDTCTEMALDKDHTEGVIIHEAFEKCGICTLNICNELFGQELLHFKTFFSYDSSAFSFKILSLINSFSLTKGRSPPTISLIS